MHQIIAKRFFVRDGETHEYDKVLATEGAYLDSVRSILANAPALLDTHIEKKERYNLFFTPYTASGKKRDFVSSECLWFDFDGIDVSRLNEYPPGFAKAIGVPLEKLGIVCSGRGLHFYVGLTTPIADREYFSKTKDHYKKVLEDISAAWLDEGLPNRIDTSVYNHRQFMRLPETLNKKKDKEDAFARVIQVGPEPVDFDIVKLSGLPLVDGNDHIDAKSFKGYKPDPEPIFQGCEFLKHARTAPEEVSEPEWYAALSITARCANGAEVSHTLSRGHKSYSKTETDRKIEQSLKASGPRTCENINQLWGQCSTCPNFQKVTSPILIKDPDAIHTRDTGFHFMHYDKKTKSMKLGKPDYVGLAKFFEQQKGGYVSTSKQTWHYNGKYYEPVTDDTLRAFAQEHFKPECLNNMVNEFKELIWRTHVWEPGAWDASRDDKVNFLNGVLDLKTGELLEHGPEYGFKNILPYDYDASATAPTFKKFLSEVTLGREPLERTLEEYMGYSLSGMPCIYQRALVMEGIGANGKSTFIEVLKSVAGDKSYSALTLKELGEREARSALDGVLFNIAEETPAKIHDSETFKNLIVGGEISVRQLFKDSYKIRNKAKLVFSCNRLPVSSDTSDGFFRRLLIVPFAAKFDQENKNVDIHMPDKLKLELPGIFNICLEGMRRLKAQKKFTKELTDDKELAAFKILADPLRYWLKEATQDDAEGVVATTKLYESYRSFLEEAGYDKQVVPRNVFIDKLRHVLPGFDERYKPVKIEGKTVRAITGITTEIHSDKDF